MDSLRMICAGGCGRDAESGEGLCITCLQGLMTKLAWSGEKHDVNVASTRQPTDAKAAAR